MKAMRLHVGTVIWTLVLALAASASAQDPTERAPVSIETSQAAEQPDDVRDFRFRRAIFRLGQDYTLRAGDTVREVRSTLGAVTIEGRVEGDVVVVLGKVLVASSASIGGSLVVVGGNATIQQGATVGRDLVVVGGTLDAPAAFSPDGEHVVIGTAMLGNALQGIVPWFTRGLLWGRLIVPGLPWMWALVGFVFFVGLVLNFLFDGPVKACAGALATQPLSAFLTGLLVLLLSGPLLIVLAASVIGLVVVPFAACAVMVASILGKIGVARAIGAGVIHESEDGSSRLEGFRSFVIGFVVLCLAYMVPILGLITWATVGALGLGAATMTFFAALRRERPAPGRAPEAPVPAAATAAPAPAAFVAEGPAEWNAAAPATDAPTTPPRPTAPMGDLAIYPRATFLDRLAAFALDCVLVGIANAVLNFDHDGGWFFLLLLAYHIAFWAWKGTTLGGIVCSLRVIRTHGTDLRFVDALVRGLASVFSIAALGIGCFWMLQDAERQMWHDKIAGTLVVKVPRQLVLP